MNDRPPHIERDHVLVDVKAKPFGWAYGPSLDLDSGRGPMARSGAPAPEIHKFRSLRIQGIAGVGAAMRVSDDPSDTKARRATRAGRWATLAVVGRVNLVGDEPGQEIMLFVDSGKLSSLELFYSKSVLTSAPSARGLPQRRPATWRRAIRIDTLGSLGRTYGFSGE